jgi:putative transposase
MQQEPHRKRVVHFDVEGHAHLLTFSCYQRRQLLTNESWFRQLSFNINRTMERHRCGLIAFVYMPEHIHLLVYPSAGCKVEEILYAIKKPFSDRIKLLLKTSDLALLQSLTIRERPGKQTFRFWQEGGGHDRNLISVESCVKAAEYLHNNPVRRRLCSSPELWRWSSWKFYHQPGHYDDALPKVHGFPH